MGIRELQGELASLHRVGSGRSKVEKSHRDKMDKIDKTTGQMNNLNKNVLLNREDPVERNLIEPSPNVQAWGGLRIAGFVYGIYFV